MRKCAFFFLVLNIFLFSCKMNKWQGKTVKINGRISQINDPETSHPKIYLDCSGDWDWSLEWDYKKIYVTYTYSDNEAHFLENDRIIVYGTVSGMSEHHSQLDVFGLASSKLPETTGTGKVFLF